MPSRGGRAHRLRTSDDDGIDEADEHDAGVSTWERTVSIVPGRARCERVVHIATAAEDVDDFDNIIAHELAGREEGSGGRAFAKRSAPLATKVGVNRPKPSPRRYGISYSATTFALYLPYASLSSSPSLRLLRRCK